MSIDDIFEALLKDYDSDVCPGCGKKFDKNDVYWRNSQTEDGFLCCTVKIQCHDCGHELLHDRLWWTDVDDFDDLVYNTLKELLDNKLASGIM